MGILRRVSLGVQETMSWHMWYSSSRPLPRSEHQDQKEQKDLEDPLEPEVQISCRFSGGGCLHSPKRSGPLALFRKSLDVPLNTGLQGKENTEDLDCLWPEHGVGKRKHGGGTGTFWLGPVLEPTCLMKASGGTTLYCDGPQDLASFDTKGLE